MENINKEVSSHCREDINQLLSENSDAVSGVLTFEWCETKKRYDSLINAPLSTVCNDGTFRMNNTKSSNVFVVLHNIKNKVS